MKWLGRLTCCAAIIWLAVLPHELFFGGNTALAASVNFELNCPAGQRVIGVETKYAVVIDQIRARCTPITSTGRWGTNQTFTAWSGTNAPNPATTVHESRCAQDRFVVGLNFQLERILGPGPGADRYGSVIRVYLSCGEAFRPVNSGGSTLEIGPSTTSNFGPLYYAGQGLCGSSGIASALIGKRDWYLDHLGILCADPPAVLPGAPTLVRPVWNSPILGYDTGQVGVTLVQLRPVPNAAKYRICMRDFNAPNCYFDEERSASSGLLMNDGSIQFQIPIPQNKQHTVSEWSAGACYSNNVCGSHSPRQRFLIVPNPPILMEPADPTMLTNGRTVTFTWSPHPLASAGYQLLLFTSLPEDIGFTVYNPTAVLPPNQSISIPVGTTSHTLTLAPNQNVVSWTMVSCADFPEKGRRCSTRLAPRRTLSVFTGLQLPGIKK